MHEDAVSLSAFQSLLAEEPALAVYFSAPNCGVCHLLFPRIEQMLQSEYPRLRLLRIDTAEAVELAAQMGILSVPSLIIYLDHREAYRYVRQFSVEALRQDLQRPYHLLFDA